MHPLPEIRLGILNESFWHGYPPVFFPDALGCFFHFTVRHVWIKLSLDYTHRFQLNDFFANAGMFHDIHYFCYVLVCLR